MSESKSENYRINILSKLRENNEKSIPDSRYSFNDIFKANKKYKYINLNDSKTKTNNNSVTFRGRQLPNLNISFINKAKLLNKSKEITNEIRATTHIDFMLDKNLKKNLDETTKLDDKENLLDTSIDEKEVLNLNFWEMDHVNDDDSNHSELNISNLSCLSKKSELEALNFQGQENTKIRRLAIKGRSQLKTINDQKEEEYGIILLQNINFSKNNFNFEIFRRDTRDKIENKKDKQKFEDIIGKKIDTLKQSTQLFGVSESVLKAMNFHLRGNIDSLNKSDQYREIIKEKQKKENKFRGELIKIGQTIIDKKHEKRKLIMDIAITAEIFQKFQSSTQIAIDKLESLKQSLNHLYANIVTNNNIEVLHKIKSISSVFYNSVYSSTSSEVRRQLVREKIENVDKEIKELNLKLNTEKNKTNIHILDAKKQMKIINKEKKQLKYKFKTNAKEQRTYYADILKKGIDVRDQGLVWVIKRLMELSSQLDYTTFPAYLEKNYIDYLLTLAEKQIKCNQKKIMLKTLKEKQKKMREEENNEKFMGISKNSFNKLNHTNKSKFFFDHNKTSKSFNKTVFSNKTVMEFDRILQKYEKMIKKTFEKKVEDMQIQELVDTLKEQLKNSNSENQYIEPTGVNIEKFFNENKKHKECFDEILLLRKEIEALEKEYIQMRQNQMALFKLKFENFKGQNNKLHVHYDLIHAALFGNNIYV